MKRTDEQNQAKLVLSETRYESHKCCKLTKTEEYEEWNRCNACIRKDKCLTLMFVLLLYCSGD